MIAVAHHRRTLRRAASRYRHARRALRTPSSRSSRYGLDWMNFFIADVQTGFGTFVAFYLARLHWPSTSIGVALAAGTLAAVLSQIPGGALADAIAAKRALTAIGIVMIGAAALILALAPSFIMVFVALILQGLTAGIITPAIGALSLGLVGRRAMSARTGRNYRFAAAGHALTAAMMGAAGTYVSEGSTFIAAAALCIPALVALAAIRPQEIDYARARNAGKGDKAANVLRIRDLAGNRALLLFTGCLVLFQLADASTLPLVAENLAQQAGAPAALMAGLVIVPQVVVAFLAPWVGYHSEAKGRRPLLLIGFALEPIRAALLAFTADYPLLIVAQLLNGVTSAIVLVLTVLVVTDLTAGTGRFNLATGFVGTASAIAASASTSASGFIFQEIGRGMGFASIAIIGVAATALLWVFQSESKPTRYGDEAVKPSTA